MHRAACRKTDFSHRPAVMAPTDPLRSSRAGRRALLIFSQNVRCAFPCTLVIDAFVGEVVSQALLSPVVAELSSSHHPCQGFLMISWCARSLIMRHAELIERRRVPHSCCLFEGFSSRTEILTGPSASRVHDSEADYRSG